MTIDATKKLLAMVAAGFFALALSACEEQGPAEQAGEAVDNTVDQAGEAVEDADDAVKDATSN